MIFDLEAQKLCWRNTQSFKNFPVDDVWSCSMLFLINYSLLRHLACNVVWLLCRTYWREQQREVERVVLDPSLSYCKQRLEHSIVYPVTNKKNMSEVIYYAVTTSCTTEPMQFCGYKVITYSRHVQHYLFYKMAQESARVKALISLIKF